MGHMIFWSGHLCSRQQIS